MKHCDNCERETHSAHDMTPTGAVVEMCAACSHKRPAAKPEPAKPGLAKAAPTSDAPDGVCCWRHLRLALE